MTRMTLRILEVIEAIIFMFTLIFEPQTYIGAGIDAIGYIVVIILGIFIIWQAVKLKKRGVPRTRADIITSACIDVAFLVFLIIWQPSTYYLKSVDAILIIAFIILGIVLAHRAVKMKRK